MAMALSTELREALASRHRPRLRCRVREPTMSAQILSNRSEARTQAIIRILTIQVRGWSSE